MIWLRYMGASIKEQTRMHGFGSYPLIVVCDSRQGNIPDLEDPLLRHAYDRLIPAITINKMKLHGHCSTSTTLLLGSGHDLQLISRVPPCSLKHIDTSCSLQHIDGSTICFGHASPRTDDSYHLQSPVLPRLRAL
ncbi:hypothetical protein F2Q70_00038352 [Brassica cretica]|uniref:Uncharacterized protein n=1 Tax=Brassica cretica TaxID=69181 RepID=A0A8S9K429_BRACR|nr:hypothetical protein F2Q70_00038352 [Brassica cretica]KAF2618103.1 hypothetical protein F2Q68_00038952 [Brassica cretica]